MITRTLKQEDHPNVTIISGDVAAALVAIRQTSGKEIWLFGGGNLFQSLLQLGEVDKIEVGLVPKLLGRGIPFLPGLDQITRLELAETHRYPSGIMMLTYDVIR